MQEKKAIILVAGSDERNLRTLETLLRPAGYQVDLAQGGEVLEKINANPPQVIFLDALAPDTDVFEVLKRLKADDATRLIPVVIITPHDAAKTRIRALEAGVDDFLSQPFDQAEVTARLNSLLKVSAYNNQLKSFHEKMETEIIRRTESMKQAFERVKSASLDTIFRLSQAAEYKDEDTGTHIQRMSHYATAIARKMGMSEEFIEYILFAAPMHDIGKIGIPDNILQKPGKLDAEEWEIMKQHTTIGAQILKDSSVEFIKMAEVIARTHHEKWDGSGYPQGLMGESIPIPGRIIAIADVFDALTSERPYKEPFPIEKAFEIIHEGKGKHFDARVVDAFFAIEDEIAASLNWWKFLWSEPGEPGQDDKLFP
ncbi:MAG: HD domain-containing phosphohydrolase [Chloroflexota bacterium]